MLITCKENGLDVFIIEMEDEVGVANGDLFIENKSEFGFTFLENDISIDERERERERKYFSLFFFIKQNSDQYYSFTFSYFFDDDSSTMNP